eukprot:CAMPEP_0181320640 /NCGR_PEP_ID=MMETSP1101-20121128/18237_1 /TAXON_ID=46948 /ORGANISM="Rhodomonas abbreviata, Strain Caron Lab Isolate" /LENGTH=93 /DNA_ID=CAMNT_0023428369 /DNA_START=98 /DNA_END=380 /DNA_ORIENTATION=+
MSSSSYRRAEIIPTAGCTPRQDVDHPKMQQVRCEVARIEKEMEELTLMPCFKCEQPNHVMDLAQGKNALSVDGMDMLHDSAVVLGGGDAHAGR